MVDCFDRIAVQMTEIALEPILKLAEQPMLTTATVRLPRSNGRRVLLTVSKCLSEGNIESPVFDWTLEHEDGSTKPHGVIAASAPDARYSRPDDAFWGAVDALRGLDAG